jgi:hypothetical protein
MKQSNEYIKLRLYTIEEAIGILDCLFNNGYTCIENIDIEIIKKNMINAFNQPNGNKYHYVYFIEIDNEIREYKVHSKILDKLGIRSEKLKKIMNNL